MHLFCINLSYNVKIRPIGVLGDVLIAVFIDYQDIVLSVAACPSLAFRDCQHWFHGYDHPWFQNCVDIFSELQTRLTAVEM